MKSGESKKSTRALLWVPMIFLLLSCVSKPEITGKWREVGKTATIEFSADGDFKAIDNQGMAVSGRYTLSKDGKLRCEVRQGGSLRDIVKLTVSIQGDELTLTSPESSGVEKYRREK